MWNYSFAIPSLLILGLLLTFYFSLPRLRIRLYRAFLYLLGVESLVIFSDVVSSWADSIYYELPVFLVYVLNILYFVMFFLRAGMIFYYVLSILKLRMHERLKFSFLVALPMIICIIVALFSPINHLIFYIDGDGYHSGAAYNILYICFWFYLILAFYSYIAFRNTLRRRRERMGLLLFLISLTIGIIVRKVYPNILLMDTFCLISVITVYLAFENPEFYIERRGNVFNSMAFKEYVEEFDGILTDKVLGIVIHNYNELRDIYGGAQMDEGLVMISEFITGTFPKFSVFYHRGGRFMVMCPGDSDLYDALSIVKRRFRKPWKSETADLFLNIGTVIMNPGAFISSSDNLLSLLIAAYDKADKALNGEPVVIDSDAMDQNIKDTEIRRLLENAIEKRQVEVYLQPIADSKTGRIRGAEALCRLKDNDGNIIGPDKFLGIAERNGKLNELGEQVFEKTCIFIKEHDLKENGIEWINVNLSPIQFLRSDLADRYSDIVKKHGVDMDLIHLEITEEALVDYSFLEKQMADMRARGFSFVLDDYGTGYSNLSRLKKCPFINIKIDMSVVWDYCKEPDNLLPTMTGAFKTMGFLVTAEGIEDENMAGQMKNIGCDFLQGYYYSRPVPMEEFSRKYLEL